MNYNQGEGTDVEAFHIPSRADIPAQKSTHTEDLHTRLVTRQVAGGEALHPSGGTVQRARVSGRKPLEAMIRTYPLDEINQAVKDTRSGASVKAVLLH